MSPDFIPSTVLEAVNALYATLDKRGEEVIANHPPASVHHTSGMAVRNNWSLWEKETPLKRDAVENYGIAHADDISGLIMAWVWAKERGESFDSVAHCKVYRKHWQAYGTTALQAGGYNDDKTPMP